MKKVTFTRPQRRTQEAQSARAQEALGIDEVPSRVRASAGGRSPARAMDPGLGGGPPLKGGTTTPHLLKNEITENDRVDNLLAEVGTLSAADRKELLARLALSESDRGGADDRDLTMWSQAIYEALVKLQGTSVPGPAVIKKLVGVPAAWTPLHDFMVSTKLQELTVVNRRSVYVLLARLVVEDAQDFCSWARAPLAPKIVANRCRHVASTFNLAFPGYIEAGLVGIVARKLGGGSS